ncbi:DUF3429 domain-containing protein [Idiomarina seosinensis]|uniref:DUF3429 domain-containing protein n=1 Tax=Idiomarina seosinensis TaxID=281739 RepID=A0A432ZIV9_9GAMM|nr:DUF3429 domain-containing protein [Idiomarina seosinensis]RUO77824.1 DUF3429 domain-containing protein [Idiomarina seosinensis]
MGTAKTKIMQLLGFAGLIPFLVFSLAQLMGVKLPLPVAPMTLLLTYGAIILSFLAGILWGRAIHRADSEPTNSLLVLSNAFALLAWFSLLLDSVFWALLIQMVGFALVLTFERVLARGSLMTTQSGYYPMRLILTAGVIVCQLLVLGNHIF